MSHEATTWALNVPVGGTEKVVLLGIANHAHPDGSEAYPSLETLGRYAHCNRSTVWRNLRKLEAAGWIVRDGEHYAGGRRDRALVKWRLPMTGLQNATPQPERGCAGATSGVAPVQPEPSLEPSTDVVVAVDVPFSESSNGGPSSSETEVGAQRPAQARAREAGWSNLRFAGKPVSASRAELAAGILERFNETAGTNYRPYTTAGKASESLKRILGALQDNPDLTLQEATEVIRWRFANPYWEGAPGTGVVFGPKVFEANRASASGPQRLHRNGQVDWAAATAELRAQGL